MSAWRKSSNNPYVGPTGWMNAPAMEKIGGNDNAPGSRFPGQLGAIWVGNNGDALKVSNPTASVGGTLYMGVYQLVKFTSAMVKGAVCFWDTLANNGLNDYEVTAVGAATSLFKAGICLYTDASATGRFGWIQTGGLAVCQYRASVTSAVIGNLVTMVSATDETVDAIADATDYFTSALQYKLIVGQAYETPANSGLLRVLLDPSAFFPNASS